MSLFSGSCAANAAAAEKTKWNKERFDAVCAQLDGASAKRKRDDASVLDAFQSEFEIFRGENTATTHAKQLIAAQVKRPDETDPHPSKGRRVEQPSGDTSVHETKRSESTHPPTDQNWARFGADMVTKLTGPGRGATMIVDGHVSQAASRRSDAFDSTRNIIAGGAQAFLSGNGFGDIDTAFKQSRMFEPKGNSMY